MSDGFVFIEPNAHLTPAEVDLCFNRLSNEIAEASRALVKARDRELEARTIYEKGRDRLLLSDARPRVGRSKGDITVDEREAWIRSRIGDEFWIYETTKVDRENAESYTWALKDQIRIVQSLGVTARQAFEGSGRTR
ncbi:MAG: hypothetical protein JWN52_6610 [Actinomycetia bacterium]|nr:hypothetical protein [Actinomycetes bacterium]